MAIKAIKSQLLSPIGLMVGATTIFASMQSVSADPQETVATPSGTPELTEIVVTANKREQRLQDVGLSVTALSGDTLAEQRIENVEDLAKVVPGLSFAPSPNSTPVYTLRGVGFYETSVAAYPDVSVYLDQAPLPLPVMSALTAFDLQRVEVLKGPQGTLFGNNATGGAINFLAAKPTRDLQAGATLSYGRFNEVETSGFVSGPLGDTLQARLAVKVVHSDDWQYSYTRDDSLGATRNAAFRFLVAWQPIDGLDVNFNLNGWQNRSDPQAPQLARQSNPSDLQIPVGAAGPTGTIGPDFPFLSYPAAPNNARAADWSINNRPTANNRLTQFVTNASYAFSSNLALTSISSFVHYRMQNSTEGDGTALNDLDITSDHADATSFSQELRLAGTVDRLRWVLGANYERTSVNEAVNLLFPDASSGAQQGFSADSYDSDQLMKNYAGFGNLEFAISRQITLRTGVRYTQADRSTSSGTIPTPGYTEPFPGSPGLDGLLNFVWPNVYIPLFCPGVDYTPIVPGNSVSIDPKTCQTGRYVASLNQNNVSWSFGTDFKLTPDALLYVNISKGYKAGSFPEVSAATKAQYAPVTQESVVDYETGFKVQAAGGRMTLNGAIFHYDYRNKQLRGKEVDPIFGLLDTLVNVPKSEVNGAEIELDLRPVRALAIRFAATYLETKVQEYDGIIGVTRTNGLGFPVRASFTGTPLPFSPKFQGSASADYSLPLGPSLQTFVGGTIAARAHSLGSLQLAAQDVSDATIDAYATLDLRTGIKSVNDKWKVTIWGTNVTNKYYWTNALRAYDGVIRYAGRPAEYGITFDWRL